jgi:putative aminopeptidase
VNCCARKVVTSKSCDIFQRYGSLDIPLGWPLRYSHSPGEVIDTRDVDALARIIEVLAKNW